MSAEEAVKELVGVAEESRTDAGACGGCHRSGSDLVKASRQTAVSDDCNGRWSRWVNISP